MLRFTKMNGAGNDFVVVDNRSGTVNLSAEQIAHICDRHRGVGADGILLLETARNGADFRMRYYNSDGGEAEMCGNGARCFARFASREAEAGESISFETVSGVIHAQLQGELVRLQMSVPREERFGLEISSGTCAWRGHFINTGVPHVVVPVSRLDSIDVGAEGSLIRRHPMFAPAGANANFVEKRGQNRIAIRTYERGVEAETLACGTGVVASALVFAATENVNGPISVQVRGGCELTVDFRRDGPGFREVTLTGPAEFVFEGSMEV